VAHWLLKEEPTHYAWADLVRDGATRWDGVHNALALRHLRSMAVGETALFYHTGEERAAVGVVRVASAPRPDPRDDRGSWTVEVRPLRPLRRPVTLAEMRADRALAGFDLLRISRLSVVPVSDAHWRRIEALERAPVPSGAPQGPSASRRSSRRAAAARSRGAT
jgi:predicted RNA-binding protein with PUA-like domain